jgi:hypothetical protein
MVWVSPSLKAACWSATLLGGAVTLTTLNSGRAVFPMLLLSWYVFTTFPSLDSS